MTSVEKWKEIVFRALKSSIESTQISVMFYVGFYTPVNLSSFYFKDRTIECSNIKNKVFILSLLSIIFNR